MIIGYAKLEAPQTATTLNEMRDTLRAAGAEKVFIDCDMAWNNERPEAGLDTALAACKQGDTLITPSPAQLTHSLAGLITVASRLSNQGASLRVLEIAGGQMLDTATPAGAMMLGALGLMAAFEKPQAERVSAEIVPMPRRPRGRPPTASTKASEIARLRAAGMSAVDIAARLNICRASVYRVLTLGGMEQDEQPTRATIAPASLAARSVFPPVRGYQLAAC